MMIRIFLSFLIAVGLLQAADHRDASMIAKDFKADINDVYAWATADGRLNLIMTAVPNAVYSGFNSPHLFDSNVRYTFNIDADMNGTADRWIDCSFSYDNSGNQVLTAQVRNSSLAVSSLVAGPSVQDSRELTGGDAGVNLSSKRINRDVNNQMSVFAGLRDDPFYLDMEMYQKFVKSFVGQPAQNTKAARVSAAYTATLAAAASATVSHTDFFGRENVAAIAIQVTTAALSITTNVIQLDGASYRKALHVRRAGLDDASRGAWVQVDRLAKPSINIVFETANPVSRHATNTAFVNINENSFNRSRPASDVAVYGPDYSGFIKALNLNAAGGTAAQALNLTTATWPGALTGVLLPDWLRVQTNLPCVFTNKNSAGDQALAAQPGIGDLVNCYGQILVGGSGVADRGGRAFMEAGRHLTDNVIDLSLTAVVNPGLANLGSPGGLNSIVTDQVYSNDRMFNTTFPYLARPWSKRDLK